MKDTAWNKYLRSFIAGVENKVPLIDNQFVTAINFDNAATTPPFTSVLKCINNFAPWYSSIHRGTGYKSMFSTNLYENTRKVIADFVKADTNYNSIIYVKNTTEAINKLSYRLCDNNKNSVIISTSMEHHSNDLPWRCKYNVKYVKIDEYGMLDMKDLEYKLKKYRDNIKLVTITGASNVTGYINSIHEIAKLTHKYNTKILIDGAQLVPHIKVDMKPVNSEEHIDYMVFSAHKMYAPFGTGVLIGPKETFLKGSPDYVGGGTVQLVTSNSVIWTTPPEKEEAGSPNVIGAVALAKAIKTLNMIDIDKIHEHEKQLTDYTIEKLKSIPDIKIYCNCDKALPRVGIIPFNIKGMHHSITAKILSYEGGIAVRNGCFCAQPYLQKILNVTPKDINQYLKQNLLPPNGVVRISFGLYNNYKEVDILIEMLKKIINNKNEYLKMYKPDKYPLK